MFEKTIFLACKIKLKILHMFKNIFILFKLYYAHDQSEKIQVWGRHLKTWKIKKKIV